ncbi:unnamed protein product [Leptosia nina]|uniref:Uncharacterized protein n=1 Tax=Leptosia nina TaxID=320188 RepID=A0AAV1JKS6_9NEOP
MYLIIRLQLNGSVSQATKSTVPLEEERKISEYIVQILDHFKEPDPVGLPGAKIPDPYHVPDLKKYLALGGSIAFKNTAIYGISKFRILYVSVEASKMKATAAIQVDKIHARGNYVLKTWLKTYPGKYTSDVKGIKAVATATLGVDTNGKIRAQNISMDIGFTNIEVQFENSGILAFVLQGLFNSLGTFLFDSIKPYILEDAYKKVTEEINNNLDGVTGDFQFANSISPIDMVMINARNKIIAVGKDPMKVKNYNTTVSIFNIALTETCLTGISTFYRFGNITLMMENNTLIVDFYLSTQEIQGSTNWEISTFKNLLSQFGTVTFTVDYIRVRTILGQPLDTRKSPQFRKLDIELGNIQIRLNGAGTIDYIVEFAVNILPNLLRNQIVKSIEDPIRGKVQEELNEIIIEDIIKDFLPLLDQLQLKGLKLSKLFPEKDEVRYDDDDFFNF